LDSQIYFTFYWIKVIEGTKYIFTTKDLKDKKIVEGDFVSFNSEIFETVEIKEYTARAINKVSKDDIKPTE
jgi:hypothetical protein